MPGIGLQVSSFQACKSCLQTLSAWKRAHAHLALTILLRFADNIFVCVHANALVKTFLSVRLLPLVPHVDPQVHRLMTHTYTGLVMVPCNTMQDMSTAVLNNICDATVALIVQRICKTLLSIFNF